MKMRERLGLLEIDGHTTAVSVLEKDIVNVSTNLLQSEPHILSRL